MAGLHRASILSGQTGRVESNRESELCQINWRSLTRHPPESLERNPNRSSPFTQRRARDLDKASGADEDRAADRAIV
jgi:hypothetical protein